mmetsp:Transcript_2788/g.8197  ORF Transcript_2788/g.8197 Transcript_2788/m.8197 type:complete len:288 (-) Transcript_2788:108-971(-)
MSEKRKQTGTKNALMQAELSASEASNKRAKGAINSIVKEYLCPIALELPVDPVTAEDGRVYNRADIQKHIDNSKRKKDDGSEGFEYKGLKSPMTKEPMGPKLLPAIQVRNSIRTLIESGAIEGDEGNTEQWEMVDSARIKAEGGDLRAMHTMAHWHTHGKHGLIRDDVRAYTWVCKAADLDFPPSIGIKGAWLLRGMGGAEQNRVEGGTLIGIAAARGDGNAQYDLGICFYRGSHGFTKNLRMAKYWIQKAIVQDREWGISATVGNLAKEFLESIKKEEAGNKSEEN